MPAARRKTTGRKRTTAAKKKYGPGALTAAQRKKFLDAIRLGLNKDDAALLIGISRSTFFAWQQRGRERDAPEEFVKFVVEMDLALVQFEQKALGLVHQGAESEWQAAMTLLERKFPDRYGRRTRMDANVTVTATPMIDASKLTIEEQEQLIKLLRKASPSQEELAETQRPALELLAGGEDSA